MFKVNNANQILFLKNKLKDIKMDKGESIQSFFMRITQITNDPISIGEVIDDSELTLIALGGISMLTFWGSIGCALAPKLGGGSGTHEISKTQKAFGEIPSGVKVIQIIKFFNEEPKSNFGKLKIKVN